MDEQLSFSFNEEQQNSDNTQLQANEQEQEGGNNVNVENQEEKTKVNETSEKEQLEQQNVETQTDSNDDIDPIELYNYLKDYGIAPELKEDEVKFNNIDDVAKYIYENQQRMVEEKIKQELENYPQEYKDLFEYVRKGGDVSKFVENYSNNYSEVTVNDLTNDIVRDRVLKDWYKTTTQWSDDVISKHISKLDDNEKLEIGKKALIDLKNYEEAKKNQLLKEQEEQQRKQQEYINQLVTEYNKQLQSLDQIGNIQLTPKDKDEIADYLFNDKTYQKLTQNFDKYRLNLAILDKFGLLDDPNKITNILNQSSSKKKYNFKKKGNKNTNLTDDGVFDIDIVKPKHSDNQDDKINFMF